jgi:SAM-dependent methyltransferase
MRKVLVAITNYDYNDNALVLKQLFSPLYDTICIDSSSPRPLECADYVIPNSHYPGLFNKSVELAIAGNYDFLFFIASDVEFREASMLQLCIDAAVATEDLYLWTPSLAWDSRFAFKSTGNKPSSGMRNCGAIEGFCFMVRVSILQDVIFPIPSEIKIGYGIDIVLSLKAHERGIVAVDDRVIIYHPDRRAEHQIDEPFAQKESTLYYQSFVFDDQALLKLSIAEERACEPSFISTVFNTSSLDLGCGPVPQNPFVASNVFGIDIAVPAGASNIQQADLNIDKIPFAESSLDYISAFDFLEHVLRLSYVDNKPRFCFVELMNEIYRVLVPGGVFLSLTPIFPYSEAFQDPTHVNIMTDKTLPYYFCLPTLWAKMYGFDGRFMSICHKLEPEGKMLSIIRAIK